LDVVTAIIDDSFQALRLKRSMENSGKSLEAVWKTLGRVRKTLGSGR
jgi:hypothetical protein